MSPNDSPPDRSDGTARSLAIDLEELIWALNSRDTLGESSHWLNLESGELLFLAGPDAVDDVDEDPRDSDQWLFVEPIESSQAFEIMEDFAEQCRDDRLARALRQALQHRKPFRHFKDTLAAHPAQREAWFAFERHAMEAIARRWCEDHGISPGFSPRPRTPSD
ncbi:MAG: hypothetical protein KGL99_07155 [Burkholderiales bacterium]|nr:hypothetical protein [Burkholderiales bacterium]MDE2626912.1 hypothetical protein [Burkholderiales bacterium]